MILVFTNAVTKDVRKIKDEKIKNEISRIVQTIKSASSLREITSIKKLSGHQNAYRIKIGNYRLGFYNEDDSIILARFLKRNDIYKVFP